jgi:hypothetical protein
MKTKCCPKYRHFQRLGHRMSIPCRDDAQMAICECPPGFAEHRALGSSRGKPRQVGHIACSAKRGERNEPRYSRTTMEQTARLEKWCRADRELARCSRFLIEANGVRGEIQSRSNTPLEILQ